MRGSDSIKPELKIFFRANGGHGAADVSKINNNNTNIVIKKQKKFLKIYVTLSFGVFP